MTLGGLIIVGGGQRGIQYIFRVNLLHMISYNMAKLESLDA